MWPGSDFDYQGKKCFFTMSLNKKMIIEDRADVVMTWLKNGANFVMFYIEEPDEEGHAYSPDSQRVFLLIFFIIVIFCFLLSDVLQINYQNFNRNFFNQALSINSRNWTWLKD